jgi:cadmium resistance protein CadD (predicted permease)
LGVVVLGQYLGFGTIVLVSLLVSAGALLVKSEWVGFLGGAPFVIGIKGLLALRHGRRKTASTRAAKATAVLPIAALTFASGGDNIAVYGPLFARRPFHDVTLMLAVFGLLVAMWCAVAHRLLRLPIAASTLDRWGHLLAPVVLIGLGIHIFVHAGTTSAALAWMHR